jgi:hypothetical protein
MKVDRRRFLSPTQWKRWIVVRLCRTVWGVTEHPASPNLGVAPLRETGKPTISYPGEGHVRFESESVL